MPLGQPPPDYIDLKENIYVRGPELQSKPPTPPMRINNNNVPQMPNLNLTQQSYYEILQDKLEFNNDSYVRNLLERPKVTVVDRGTGNRVFASPSLPRHHFADALPPPPPVRNKLAPIYESQEQGEYI